MGLMEDFLKIKDSKTKDIFHLLSGEKIPQSIIIEHGFSEDILSFSKTLTKFIQCKNKDQFSSCLECPCCRKIENGTHPDVIYPQRTNTSETYSVSTVRKVRADSFIMPNEADFKIYVFLDAQNLSIVSQNALLKILEEPPPYVIFLFFCNNLSKILSTVKSRSEIFNIEGSVCGKTVLSIDEKAQEIEENILKAVKKKDEYRLLILTSKIEDKAQFKSILSFLSQRLRKAVYSRVVTEGISGDPKDDVKDLFSDFSFEELLNFSDTINKVNYMMERNANFNLLLTYFVSNLF